MILVTGGAGYIGSHTVLKLLDAGYQVLVLDNFSNSTPEALKRVEQLAGKSVLLVEGDIRDGELLTRLFAEHDIEAVIHFAGLKAVGESTKEPLHYYQNNVSGTIQLCQMMADAGVFNLVFSSSATVYGAQAEVPYRETAEIGGTTSPYGTSKLMAELMMRDFAAADPRWHITTLRYFNPIGAHESGLIGEDPNGIPNNLLPYISQVAVGRRDCLQIFGNDYPTPDGTGVRDYIHVMDLADGHLKALQKLGDLPGFHPFNLGAGKGYSVLEVLRAFETACGKSLSYKVVARRPGDLACYFAEPTKAKTLLNWTAERELPEMIGDTWRWQSQNPNGYVK